MLRTVFFDLDGTLADDGDSIAAALTEACRVVCSRWPELDATELAILYRQFSDAAWGDFDRHLRHFPSPEAMLAAVWNQTLASIGVGDLLVEQEAAEAYWQYRLRHCRPYSDVLSLLQNLAIRYPLCVLTNGAPAMQRAKLRAAQLASFFRHVFVGGEFARGKPDPLIFRAALEAVGCQPSQAVHVGDSLTHDVAGACGVGIHSVWINRKGLTRASLAGERDPRPDFEIATLAALSGCLEQINNGREC